MKIKLINKFLHLWDVIFTLVDHTQLRLWNHMVDYRDELVYIKNQEANNLNREEPNSWEDVE